jgi:hypothetical protein
MGGTIITASVNMGSSNAGQSRLMDQTIGWCGHPGFIVSSSFTSVANSLGKGRIGEQVIGCNIGTIISGNPVHEVGG